MAQTSFSLKYETEFTERYAAQFYEGPIEKLLEEMRDAAGVIGKLTHEALAMGMSFGFTIPKNGDEWNEDERTLREVNLFEVSVLSAGQTPAYPATLGFEEQRVCLDYVGTTAVLGSNTGWL